MIRVPVSSVTLAALLVSGCASGRPLTELLPPEPHLQQVAAHLTGDYELDTGNDPRDTCVWLPAGLEQPSWGRLGTSAGGAPQLVDPEESFVVSARVEVEPARVERVSVALWPLKAGQDLHALDELRDPPLVVQDAVAAADGETFEAVFRFEDGRGLEWTTDPGAILKVAARFLASIVVIGDDGDVTRTVLHLSAYVDPRKD